jgi:hypothetical protein
VKVECHDFFKKIWAAPQYGKKEKTNYKFDLKWSKFVGEDNSYIHIEESQIKLLKSMW